MKDGPAAAGESRICPHCKATISEEFDYLSSMPP